MNFDLAFDRLLGIEGRYVNDPRDPGGETNWGISKRSYPNLDIKALTRDGARAIYQRDFWNRIHADAMPGSVAYQAFDMAVQSSIETAVRYLQRALNVADDGHWGPVTQAAAAAMSESDVIMRFNSMRLDFYTRSSLWDTYGKGWARRVALNLLYGAVDA